jgi:hypothetical protein
MLPNRSPHAPRRQCAPFSSDPVLRRRQLTELTVLRTGGATVTKRF